MERFRPSDATFAAFDVETTGLWPAAARMVEMAAVRFRLDSDDAETFAELIAPGVPIPPRVTSIHGITDAMVRGRCSRRANSGGARRRS